MCGWRGVSPFQSLLLGSTLFFASNCALFWALIHYLHLAWLFPVFYVWVKVFGVLVPTQIWTLANYVLTTREAKRVFGMVGGGGIAGWIFSGYFSKTIAKRFGAESLLLGMVLFLLICTGLIVFIWRSGWVAGGGGRTWRAEESAEGGPRNLFGSMRVVFSSSYLRAIAAVICIGSLVTTLTGWQFLAIAQQTLEEERCAGRLFRRLQFLRWNTFAGLPVAGNSTVPAQVRHWRSTVRASRYGVAGLGGSAGFWHAGRGGGAERLRSGAALFSRQVRRRIALPSALRPDQDTSQMVHRHRGLAPG